jgi:spore maturation protein CgeB
MLIFIAGTGSLSWGPRGWAKALESLGHEVCLWDWAPLHSSGIVGRCERRFLLGPGIGRINRAMLERVASARPDVVLVYAMLPILASTVSSLAKKVWVTGYHNDNPFGGFGRKAYFRNWRAAIPRFNSHHVFRANNVENYQEMGVLRVRVLLPFYVPWIDRVPPMTAEDTLRLGHDVVFVGHAEKDLRLECVARVLSAGLPLKVYGGPEYWRRYLSRDNWRQIEPVSTVFGEDYRKVLAGSKISLCFFSQANRDEVTFRLFEITAAGGFLLCQRSALALKLFQEDREAAFFSTPDELAKKCRYYLAHENERRNIAQAGRQRCLSSKYDIVSRMEEWVSDLREWTQSR